MLTIDTCFLIDYQRESKRRQSGPVMQFLRERPDESLSISVIAWGEFIAGFAKRDHAFVQFAYDKLELLPVTERVAATYRLIYRELKETGKLIGGNDLWIAAHALSLERPLVSRNGSDFQRIRNLEVLAY